MEDYDIKPLKQKQEVSVGVYTEGKSDSKIISDLVEIKQFKYHTNSCRVTCEWGRGGDAHIILDACIRWEMSLEYNATLCVIDLDRIYKNPDLNHKLYIQDLELKAKEAGVVIIWQDRNLEEELRTALNLEETSKRRVVSIVKRDPTVLLNTSYYDKVLKAFELALGPISIDSEL